MEISHILVSDVFRANDNWIEDELLAGAPALTGIEDRAVPIQSAIELLVRIEGGRQLSALGEVIEMLGLLHVGVGDAL